MAFIKLQFKPGVSRDNTDYSNEGGWWACDKIRFRSGYPEKLGGWVKTIGKPFVGYVRQMWNWITSYQDDLLALGSNVKVYIEWLGNYYDITPLRSAVPTIAAPSSLSTIAGQKQVTFTMPTAHLAETGSYVVISGVAGTNVGGIPVSEINGNHKITVIGALEFRIDTTTAATASVASQGGAAVSIAFELAPGEAITVLGEGWGTGTWGRSTWGSGSIDTGVTIPQRDWWFDNFYNDLVMNVRNGEGYWWARGTADDPAAALGTKAVRLVDYTYNTGISAGMSPAEATTYSEAVPIKIGQLLVSQQDRHLIAFGAVPFGSTLATDFDPLLIRWADQDTPTDWTPSVLNTAGDLRISRGSRIMRAMPVRQEILIWTDASLHTLQFLGTTDVFGLQEYSDSISIASPRAVTTASNVTYWMGRDKFYAYTGRVETVPCSLNDHVFKNLNLTQLDQVVSGVNRQWNEVWWFYPSRNSSYNDSYVVLNYLENIWYYGTIERTAWLDSPMRNFPLACNTHGGDNEGYLYSHEAALDDDGMPMHSFIQSSDFDLGDGDKFMLIRRMIPDLKFGGSLATFPQVTVQMRPRNFPGGPVRADAADTQPVIQTTVEQYTEQVFIRARARQMALRIMSDGLGVQWQLGAPRIDAREDGRR